jgi:hypothetical protein
MEEAVFRKALAVAALAFAFAVPAFAADNISMDDARAFATEYKALLKKYPGATYRFHMFDERDVKADRSPRCAANCSWHPEVGLCTCPPAHQEHERIWE